jgi:hypothetical protein
MSAEEEEDDEGVEIDSEVDSQGTGATDISSDEEEAPPPGIAPTGPAKVRHTLNVSCRFIIRWTRFW